MPISPNELNKLTESDKVGLERAYEVIDGNLKSRFNGRDVYIATSVLPALSGKQRTELIATYLKKGWRSVRFDSDRDGSFLYIGK